MSFKQETFTGVITDLPYELLIRLDRQFRAIEKDLTFTKPVVRTFVDATAAAITEYLPVGAKTQYDYFFIKTDASANAVTIQADGTELINGAATTVLAAQYNKVLLTWYSSKWYILST